LTSAARAEATTVKGVDMSAQPIGLGFRVPMLVVSPFSRNPQPGGGPQVDSTVYDHTSLLRFIESWSHAIGKPAPIPDRDPAKKRPGLSSWRRGAVGDLTASLSLGRPADTSVPIEVLTVIPNRADPKVLTECTVTGTIGSLDADTEPIVQDPTIPSSISQPKQEAAKGAVRRPVPAPCAPPSKHPHGAGSGSGGGRDNSGALADTGADIPSAALGAVGVATAALLALRRRLDTTPDEQS